MPTSLPTRVRREIDWFAIFALALGAAFFAVEIVDPAPMDISAAMIISP